MIPFKKTEWQHLSTSLCLQPQRKPLLLWNAIFFAGWLSLQVAVNTGLNVQSVFWINAGWKSGFELRKKSVYG